MADDAKIETYNKKLEAARKALHKARVRVATNRRALAEPAVICNPSKLQRHSDGLKKAEIAEGKASAKLDKLAEAGKGLTDTGSGNVVLVIQ